MSRNGKPPKDVYSPWEVVAVKPEKPIKFICLSREWEAVQTHWWGKHSVRCDETPDCVLCLKRNVQVWKGYLIGTHQAGGRGAIFQITPLSAYMLEEQTESERGLLGAIIVLSRKGKRENSPLEASIRGWISEIDEMPFAKLERAVNVLYRQYEGLNVANCQE